VRLSQSSIPSGAGLVLLQFRYCWRTGFRAIEAVAKVLEWVAGALYPSAAG
jgi:hypothetical protein